MYVCVRGARAYDVSVSRVSREPMNVLVIAAAAVAACVGNGPAAAAYRYTELVRAPRVNATTPDHLFYPVSWLSFFFGGSPGW